MQYFDLVVRDDNIIINYNIPERPQYLAEYIEGWRHKIWDHGFPNYFKGHNYFKKGDSFEAHEGQSLLCAGLSTGMFQRHFQKH